MKIKTIRTQGEFLRIAQSLAMLNAIQLISYGTVGYPYVKIISRCYFDGEQVEYIYRSSASTVTPSLKNKFRQTYNYICSLTKSSK